MDGIHGETSLAKSLGDVVGERSTHGTIGVDNVALDAGGKTLVKSQLGLGDELVVEADVEAMVLLADVEGGDTGAKLVGRRENERKIDVSGLVGAQILANLEDLSTTDHLVHGAEAKLGHDGTELVGNIVEEVDDVLGSTSELLAKLRILGGDTDRASVLMKRLAKFGNWGSQITNQMTIVSNEAIPKLK